MKLFRTKVFKKDYRKLKMTDTQYARYIRYLSLLLDGKALPIEARDYKRTEISEKLGVSVKTIYNTLKSVHWSG